MLIFVAIILGLSASSAAVYHDDQKCIGKCMDSITCNLQYQKCNTKCNTSAAEIVREQFIDNYWHNNYADRLESNHTANLDRMKKNHEQSTVMPLKAGQDSKNSSKFFITANRKRSIKDELSYLDDLLISLTNSENLNDGLINEGARRSKRGVIPFEQISNAVVSLICGDPLKAISAFGNILDPSDAEDMPPLETDAAADGNEWKYSVFSSQQQYPPQEQLSQLELCCDPC